MSFLNTDDIVVLDKTIKSIGNGKTTLESAGTSRVERKATNIIGKNARKRKRRRGQGARRRGGKSRGTIRHEKRERRAGEWISD